jgi:hypothetical protein
MTAGELRWMRLKMRPLGPGWVALTFARGDEIRGHGMGSNGRAYASLLPCPGRLARRVGGVNGGACAIASRRRQALLTPTTWGG